MLSRATARCWCEAAALITPKLVEFGVHLFGERLPWALKEMWVNVLDTGGRQAMHNHANSFISGVVLPHAHAPGLADRVHEVARAAREFLFKNDHQGMTPGEFSADKWISPAPEPGDMVLFPSYLMHAVPPNQGERRITLSFNAIPAQLELLGLRDQVRRLSEARGRCGRAAGVAGADGGVGFAGLGYQIVWTQQCSLWLGHESAAVLAVVTAFFGGLAVGGLALGARIETKRAPACAGTSGCELVDRAVEPAARLRDGRRSAPGCCG